MPDSKLNKLFAQINKKFGENSIGFMDSPPPVNTFSTGSLTLDLALGVGGLAEGRIVEVYG